MGETSLNWREISTTVARRLAQQYGIEVGREAASSPEMEDLQAFLDYLEGTASVREVSGDAAPGDEASGGETDAPAMLTVEENAVPDLVGMVTEDEEGAMPPPDVHQEGADEDTQEEGGETSPEGFPDEARVDSGSAEDAGGPGGLHEGVHGLVFLPLEDGDAGGVEGSPGGREPSPQGDRTSRRERGDRGAGDTGAGLVMDVPEELLREPEDDGEDGIQFVPL